MTKMLFETNGGKHLAATLLLVTGLLACSVKEDRTPCPCYLHVSLADTETEGPFTLQCWNGSLLFREELRSENCRPFWSRAVEKGFPTVSACRGIRQSEIMENRVTVPEGRQADSLYTFCTQVDATGEFASVPVSFHKQFATVFLDIRKTAGELTEYRVSVEGNTYGIDLRDNSPLPGRFHFAPVANEGDAILRFRLPRQADEALSISISHEDDGASVFPLGEIIRDTGYNWKSEDLQDIYVSIDLTRGKVHIVTGEWENGMNLPFVNT